MITPFAGKQKKYSQKQYVSTTLASTATETDILNITGTGYLLDISTAAAAANTFIIKAYIDGILTFSQKTDVLNSCALHQGFVYAMAAGSALTSLHDSTSGAGADNSRPLTSLKGYPSTSNTVGGFCMVDGGIPFFSSLRITITRDALDGTNNKVSIDYRLDEGGVM